MELLVSLDKLSLLVQELLVIEVRQACWAQPQHLQQQQQRPLLDQLRVAAAAAQGYPAAAYNSCAAAAQACGVLEPSLQPLKTPTQTAASPPYTHMCLLLAPAAQAWKEQLYPLLKQHLAAHVDSSIAYLLLYHEAAVANLLEVSGTAILASVHLLERCTLCTDASC